MPGIRKIEAPPTGKVYDVAVIGAGIVGLFVARELSKYNVSVVVIVIVREPDVGWGLQKATLA